jgi:hypothetical protein
MQVAPENTDDALVYSGYYLARVSERPASWLQATRQDSDISTLGGAAVAGKGEIFGIRAMIDLPTGEKFYQSFNFGIDYKISTRISSHRRDSIAGPDRILPDQRQPLRGLDVGQDFTELNNSLNFTCAAWAATRTDYDNKRYNADGSFIYLRSDASHTRDLENGAQVFGKLQGQAGEQPADQQRTNRRRRPGIGPRLSGSHRARRQRRLRHLRSPQPHPDRWGETPTRAIRRTNGDSTRSCRCRRASASHDALPGQKSRATRQHGHRQPHRWREHYNGSVDVAMPLIEQANADDGSIRVTFRGWADF